MASKLNDITTSFHLFEKNQILTERQLNEFLDYFDDQDRLTRISLSGVGIVCGFGVSITKKSHIVIKQGAGVTTDGDLIHLRVPGSETSLKNINIPDIPYTNYKKFTDLRAKYEPFAWEEAGETIWEIIPSDELDQSNPEPPLSDFAGLEDMVIILYLECYEDEPNLCDGISCDNQGIQQVARLRVLMVSQAYADHILESDQIFNKHELMSTYLKMKDLSVKRVMVTASNSTTIDALQASYRLSNEAELLSDLKSGLRLMNKKITPYFANHPIDKILNAIDVKLPATTANQPIYFQYRYDLLKDIVSTYNEAKEQFIEVATECCPSITSFPKHLMLGKVKPSDNDALIGSYLHKFYKSPILVDESKQFEPFIWTLFRMLHQLDAYPAVSETATKGGLARPEIKITPSKQAGLLGEKAVPFYYNLTDTLLRAWNRDKTLKGKFRSHYSYTTGVLDPSPAIQTPLLYNLENSDFLRIEGHQGRDYKEAMAKIDEIKKKNGLSFDLKAISIDVDSNLVIDTTNYECEFEDLAVLLEAWVKEQECTVAKVISLVSAFSVKEPGKNIKDAQFTVRESAFERGIETQKSGSIATSVSSPDQRKAIENNKKEYGRSNVVLESATPTELTVGHSYIKAVLQNPKGTSAEYIAEANLHANEVVIEHQVEWKKDVYTALVKNSIQIMAYSHVLSNSIPMTISGITDDVIARYSKNITNLCTVLNQIQVSQSNVVDISNNNRAILSLLITQLSNICCAAKQLQTLLVEIDRRKDSILEKLTLKKFIEQHPGLEHLGGVTHGGTFVLVYARKGAPVKTSTAVLLSEAVAAAEAKGAEAVTAEAAPAASSGKEAIFAEKTQGKTRSADPTKSLDTQTEVVSERQKLLDAKAAAAEAKVAAVNLFTAPNGTVIADFCLPYMCCSDCSPINFIMPAPVVRLSLPKDVYCLEDETTDILTFRVEPASGIIKADQEIPGLTIVGNQLFIDPLVFPASSLNQEIHFTVNDQLTNCKLTVVKPLSALIDAPDDPISTPIVNFAAIGNFPAGTVFSWNFGDGNTSSLRNVTHTYTLPVNAENKLDVTLTVSQNTGACPTIVTKTLTFEEITISLDDSEFCINDTTAYPFTIKPAGATVDISGLGVDVIKHTFTPSDALVGTVPIYLNGTEVLSLLVKPDPTVSITTVAFDDKGLNLSGVAEDADSTEWSFESREFSLPPIKDELTTSIPISAFGGPAGTPFTVILTATNGCGVKKVTKATTTPSNTEMCKVDVVNDLKEGLKRLNEFMGSADFNKLTAEQQSLFAQVKKYYTLVERDPGTYISGSENVSALNQLASMINSVYNQISLVRNQNLQQRDALVGLYGLVMQLFLSITQCQNEKALSRFKPLYEQIIAHLDPSSETSFTKMKINIDPKGTLLKVVIDVMEFRVPKTPSWEYLEKYRIFLTGGKRGDSFQTPPVEGKGPEGEISGFTPPVKDADVTPTVSDSEPKTVAGFGFVSAEPPTVASGNITPEQAEAILDVVDMLETSAAAEESVTTEPNKFRMLDRDALLRPVEPEVQGGTPDKDLTDIKKVKIETPPASSPQPETVVPPIKQVPGSVGTTVMDDRAAAKLEAMNKKKEEAAQPTTVAPTQPATPPTPPAPPNPGLVGGGSRPGTTTTTAPPTTTTTPAPDKGTKQAEPVKPVVEPPKPTVGAVPDKGKTVAEPVKPPVVEPPKPPVQPAEPPKIPVKPVPVPDPVKPAEPVKPADPVKPPVKPAEPAKPVAETKTPPPAADPKGTTQTDPRLAGTKGATTSPGTPVTPVTPGKGQPQQPPVPPQRPIDIKKKL